MFHMSITGKVELEIIKKNEDMTFPVLSDIDEKVGNSFSLVCQLVVTGNETSVDDQLSWVHDDKKARKRDRYVGHYILYCYGLIKTLQV